MQKWKSGALKEVAHKKHREIKSVWETDFSRGVVLIADVGDTFYLRPTQVV
jgi:hypothetical protein